MIQVMEQLLLAGNPPAPVTEEEIRAEFELRREELRRPPRYSFEHLYFNRDREGEVEQVSATRPSVGLSPTEARELSSPFLPGYRFTRQTPDQLARHFGATFVRNLQATEPRAQSWVGPIRSTYGLHYVWVSEVEAERDATLEEVRLQLVRDLESRAKLVALRDSQEALREQYEVIQ
jgi:hypothetical protein